MKKKLTPISEMGVVRKERTFFDHDSQDIKKNLLILPQLESLIPPLLPDEYAQLEANIRKEGCREPLLVWHTTGDKIGSGTAEEPVYVLIDGHNRYSICQRHAVDFRITLRDYADLEAVRQFMIDNQLGRRNLTPEQMSYLRGLKYLAVRKSTGGDRKSDRKEGPESPESRKTKEVLAEQFGVSPRTIMNDVQFAKGLDRLEEPLKKEVLSRQVKLSKKDIVALGERAEVAGPVASPEDLNRLLTDPAAVVRGPDAEVPAEGNARKSPSAPKKAGLGETVNRIVDLANTLKKSPSPTLETCEELLGQVQQMIRKLKAKA